MWAGVAVGGLLCVPAIVLTLRQGKSVEVDSVCEQLVVRVPLSQVRGKVESFVRNIEVLAKSAPSDLGFNAEFGRCVWGAEFEQPSMDCKATDPAIVYGLSLYGSPNGIKSKEVDSISLLRLRAKPRVPECAGNTSWWVPQ